MKSETMYNELLDEVERLKKELEEHKAAYTIDTIAQYEKGYWEGEGKGLVEGERRAMERVKEAIKTSLTAYQIESKLGLGEENSRNQPYANKEEKE